MTGSAKQSRVTKESLESSSQGLLAMTASAVAIQLKAIMGGQSDGLPKTKTPASLPGFCVSLKSPEAKWTA
jgi:hypothetical protein